MQRSVATRNFPKKSNILVFLCLFLECQNKPETVRKCPDYPTFLNRELQGCHACLASSRSPSPPPPPVSVCKYFAHFGLGRPRRERESEREREAIKGQRERERERGKEGGKDECILHLVAPGQRCEKGRRRRRRRLRRLRGPATRMHRLSLRVHSHIHCESIMSVHCLRYIRKWLFSNDHISEVKSINL